MTPMQRALSLARQALGSTSPNPSVGAVVVKDGEVVGEGFTRPPGQAHAEIVALAEAGERARGGVLYTTLEPCSHHGRTPPCTDAVLKARIAEVHAAMTDPNPHVGGNGLAELRSAGVRTHVGEGEEEARTIVEAYVKFVETGLPMVTVKFAASLDGRLATRTGESQWITGDESLRFAHKLRATNDAIMVGINTVLADDSRLTARDSSDEPLERQPLRVVVDSRGRMPPGAKMLGEPGRTMVAVGNVDDAARERIEGAGAEIVQVPSSNGHVDLTGLMKHLGERDVTSVMVEGGGTLIGALFDKGLVDKVVACIAPTVIGGKDAPSAVMGLGVEHLSDAFRLQRVEVEPLGRDVMVVGYV